MNLVQEASIVAGKDLRIEARSRVTMQQIGAPSIKHLTPAMVRRA